MITEHIKKNDTEREKKRTRLLGNINVGSAMRSAFERRNELRRSQSEAGHHDLIYQGKEVDLRRIPVAREMYLKKKDTVLGNRFKKTLLGYTKGATNQYRGPHSTHVREYSDHYTIHRDFIDPRKNPVIHLAKDAPMELAGWIIGGLIALVIIVFLIF
ncbi:MAG TPA: hypothetical protein VJ944_04080 [Thermoplasmataceae archaeon]|nr:hypothetical protein [Thermoplasmataceae archaeon]